MSSNLPTDLGQEAILSIILAIAGTFRLGLSTTA
jgi:hypothetical protein